MPGPRGARRGPSRGTTLGWLATLCAAATLALVVTLLSAGSGSVHTATSRQVPPTGPRAARPAPSHVPSGPASVSPATAPSGPASVSPATAPSTVPAATAPAAPSASPAPASRAPASPAPAPPPPAPPGGGPVIASMSPASGPAGTAVTLTGSGFFSASGSIVVLFGQVQAPVSCPTQQTCVAQAPPQATPPPAPGAPPPSPAVPVTVSTDSGHSAPVVFTYTG